MYSINQGNTSFRRYKLAVILIIVLIIAGLSIYFLTRPSPLTREIKGWKSVDLKYEKLNFKHPANWKLSENPVANGVTNNVKPGSDNITITSPSGLRVIIDTGVTGGSSDFDQVLSSSPITTLGNSYYLDFYSNTASDQNIAQGACVGTTATNNPAYPYSKNVSAASKSGGKPFDVICIDYAQDSMGYIPRKTVAAFQSDPYFNEAKTIIESLSYSRQ
jgi:hypothetical protein